MDSHNNSCGIIYVRIFNGLDLTLLLPLSDNCLAISVTSAGLLILEPSNSTDQFHGWSYNRHTLLFLAILTPSIGERLIGIFTKRYIDELK